MSDSHLRNDIMSEEIIICQFCKYEDVESKFKFGGHPGGRQIWVHTCPKCKGCTRASNEYLERKKKSNLEHK